MRLVCVCVCVCVCTAPGIIEFVSNAFYVARPETATTTATTATTIAAKTTLSPSTSSVVLSLSLSLAHSVSLSFCGLALGLCSWHFSTSATLPRIGNGILMNFTNLTCCALQKEHTETTTTKTHSGVHCTKLSKNRKYL